MELEDLREFAVALVQVRDSGWAVNLLVSVLIANDGRFKEIWKSVSSEFIELVKDGPEPFLALIQSGFTENSEELICHGIEMILQLTTTSTELVLEQLRTLLTNCSPVI
jgi:hypothetical protein